MTARVPWYVWTSLASVTCILIGAYWDISWHMTIGRDSFWTPAHLAIQLGGIVGGSCGTFLILTTTFRRDPRLRDTSVRVWGFRGPLGAFVAVWGAAAMLISAPFDNWWHDAYGLDVKILSPPHMVLTVGILGVASGGVILIASTLNRSTAGARGRLEWAMLLIGGEIAVLALTAILEHTFRSNLHRADAYLAIAIVAPMVLFTFARVSQRRWAATIVAATYTSFMIAMLWLFPLFPAEAKLGPVYQPITHFIPLQFPMLIVAPALACDLLFARTLTWPRYRIALAAGVTFVLALLAVQWPFAEFLVTEHAKNWVFGTHYHPYFMHPASPRGLFAPGPALLAGLVQALFAGVVSSYLGLSFGDALRRARR